MNPRKENFVGISVFRRSIQLDSYSCGVHSVAMIVRHFGDDTPFFRLKKELGCSPEKGTRVHSMIRAFRARKLRVQHNYRMRFRELQAALKKGRLLLVHLDGDHFGVVHGYDSKYVYLADPAPFRLLGTRMTHDAFKERWTNWSLVVRPR